MTSLPSAGLFLAARIFPRPLFLGRLAPADLTLLPNPASPMGTLAAWPLYSPPPFFCLLARCLRRQCLFKLNFNTRRCHSFKITRKSLEFPIATYIILPRRVKCQAPQLSLRGRRNPKPAFFGHNPSEWPKPCEPSIPHVNQFNDQPHDSLLSPVQR